jgi:hypothetical protein
MSREVDADVDASTVHIYLIPLCGCFLGWFVLICLCILNPLNGISLFALALES